MPISRWARRDKLSRCTWTQAAATHGSIASIQDCVLVGILEAVINSVSNLPPKKCLYLANQKNHYEVDSEKSSTYEVIDKDGFAAAYLDGRALEGDFFNDTVGIGGTSVTNQTLGIARTTIPGEGLLALGLRAGSTSQAKYPTFVDNLAAQGHIDRPAFSLFLVCKL